MITTERIYNFKKNKVKRTIDIASLDGISKTLQSGKNEFAIHIKSAYDYRFITDKRDEVVELLKQRYVEIKK